jgi:hypothetical protein
VTQPPLLLAPAFRPRDFFRPPPLPLPPLLLPPPAAAPEPPPLAPPPPETLRVARRAFCVTASTTAAPAWMMPPACSSVSPILRAPRVAFFAVSTTVSAASLAYRRVAPAAFFARPVTAETGLFFREVDFRELAFRVPPRFAADVDAELFFDELFFAELFFDEPRVDAPRFEPPFFEALFLMPLFFELFFDAAIVPVPSQSQSNLDRFASNLPNRERAQTKTPAAIARDGRSMTIRYGVSASCGALR